MEHKAVIFDFNRTLYDPETDALYDGVVELLDELQGSRNLFLYSKLEGGRDTLLKELGIADYFQNVYFVEDKTSQSVSEILEEQGLSPEECLIVGDLISSELAAGKGAGLETIWVRQGRFADLSAEFSPTYTVRSIPELRELLRTIP